MSDEAKNRGTSDDQVGAQATSVPSTLPQWEAQCLAVELGVPNGNDIGKLLLLIKERNHLRQLEKHAWSQVGFYKAKLAEVAYAAERDTDYAPADREKRLEQALRNLVWDASGFAGMRGFGSVQDAHNILLEPTHRYLDGSESERAAVVAWLRNPACDPKGPQTGWTHREVCTAIADCIEVRAHHAAKKRSDEHATAAWHRAMHGDDRGCSCPGPDPDCEVHAKRSDP